MAWNKDTQRLLELEVFKGKIVERRRGRGGLIYIVEQDAYPKKVAYKTIQEFENNLNNLTVETIRIERETSNWLQFAGHPLIIEPFFVTVRDKIPLICMPYCDGDLSELIDKKLTLTGVLCLSLQIVKGMIIANRRGMDHHQDVKPENLLYIDLSKMFHGFPPRNVDPSVKYAVKIADFGVANAWRDNHLGGTNAYKAPEQHDNTLFDTFAPDVFGVGLVIAELFQGYHPAAKSPGTKVSKWKGSKLKKWTIAGERHFAPAQGHETQELVRMLAQMLSADPKERPSFLDCYDRLSSILGSLSPNTLSQLELQFEYFDRISNYCELEDEIGRRLSLAVIPSQKELVQADIRKNLENTLEAGVENIERALRVHLLSKALYRLCRKGCTQSDKELLVKASRLLVKFVLAHHEIITSDLLWPPLSFLNPNAPKLTSDLEAKAEILNVNIERLQSFDAYDEQLKEQVKEGGAVIQACRIKDEASRAWAEGRAVHACNLLDQVRQLVPSEPEIESLYRLWTSSIEFMEPRP